MHVKPETSLVTIRRNFVEPGVGVMATMNVNSTSGPWSASDYLGYLKFKDYNPLAPESMEQST